MRIIGLFLLLMLAFASTKWYSSFVVSVEKTPQKVVELAFEKKQSEKKQDKNKLIFTLRSSQLPKEQLIYEPKESFYIVSVNDPLFRPPINI